MVDVAPDYEIKDVLGKTIHYNGTVGTSSALVPAVVVNKVSTALVRNPSSNSSSKDLYVAFDGGTTYLTLSPGEFASWSPKNNSSNTPITQIRILGSVANVAYEIVMDFEP